MLERAWSYIKSKFSTPEKSQKIAAVSFSAGNKQSRLLRSQPLPRTIFGLRQAEINTSNSSTEKQFKLTLSERVKLPEEQGQKQQIFEQHADLIDEVRELSIKMQKLHIIDKKVRQESEKIVQSQNLQNLKLLQAQNNKKSVENWMNDYRSEILNFMALKYSKERSQFAPISFQQFKEIRQYWKNKQRTSSDIKSTNFQCVKKLTYRALGGLDFRQWLNDDVINIYLQMLEKTFLSNVDSPFKLLNTYFATNVISKAQTQVQRFLKKNNFSQKDRLIMPINNRNHWYFAIFEGEEIIIYDSLVKQQSYYDDNPLFKNAIKFGKMFYDRDFTLRIRSDYPIQKNTYDCGVFMLMGIRDVLRSKQWSYQQGDIRFKRIQIASEILKERLIFAQ